MKTTVNSKSLASALSKLSPAIQAKSTLPIMECVRIVVEGAQMTVSATNLDMQLSAVIECETKKNGNGSCCIAFGKLSKAVTEIGGVIDISHKLDKATVKSTTRNASTSILTEDVSKWPEMEGIADLPETKEVDLLAPSLQAVQHAACEEENRYVMCSVFFDGDSLVSTDGKRMAIAQIESGVKAVVPVKLVRALLKAKPDTVSVSCSENLIQFDCGDFVVVGKTINSPYPSWKQVPNPMAAGIDYNKDELLSLIRQGSLSDIAIKVKCGGDKITVSSLSSTGELSSSESSANGVFDGVFSCNSDYLTAILNSCTKEVIKIGIGSGSIPQIRVESENCYFILMQRRVDDAMEVKSEEVAE